MFGEDTDKHKVERFMRHSVYKISLRFAVCRVRYQFDVLEEFRGRFCVVRVNFIA